MRVSIVTPSFNQARFLEETIRSVLFQDFPGIEYWVMDGGSTDGSVEIIRRYEGALAGWVSEKDRGQADAIIKGFARATGDILAWINSDDYYLPGALHAAVATLEQHPECGMVYGDVLAVDAAGAPINVMTFRQWGLEDLMQFKILSQPGVFMRRSVYERSGGLDLEYHYLLDHVLWMKMLQIAPMHYVPETWAAARYHPAAKNRAEGIKFSQEALRVVERMPSEPGLWNLYQKNKRKIWAGYDCYDAHYRLDGGDARGAFRSYLRALASDPLTALRHYRRMAYSAASSLVGLDTIKDRYLGARKQRLQKEREGEQNARRYGEKEEAER